MNFECFKPIQVSIPILKSILLLLLLLGLVNVRILGQNYLILQRGANQKTRLVYEEGDQLVYLQKGLDYYIQDKIREIRSDILVLEENVLQLGQIEAIDIREKDERNRTLGNLSLLPMAAGTMLLLASGINSLYADGKIEYSSGTLITGGALIGAGLILQPLRYKRFRIKGRNKIQIIPLEDLEESEGT
ncbi:hypothetical protein [Cyclobacterium jeungdonense]|uniref:Uncharacterized protein n=1 Tax=Cyclobacterium jeungdonense TaxID=708087 RepID=A0ABT8C8Y3_9BACT|nr:hypothetical protein [Cyclobacterium jeungdonense]MDN3688141.1 hypothetical protein [Cyclobacterium jeungdonense]